MIADRARLRIREGDRRARESAGARQRGAVFAGARRARSEAAVGVGDRRSARRARAAAGAQVHLESGDAWRLSREPGARNRSGSSSQRRPRFLHRGGGRQARRLHAARAQHQLRPAPLAGARGVARRRRGARREAPSRARSRPDAHRRLGADVGSDRRAEGSADRSRTSSQAPTSPPATRSSCRWRWAGPRCSAPPTSSSASTRSTTPAIPIAGPEFIRAFEQLARLATKAGVEGRPLTVHTPLIALSKADIIRLGLSLGLDYGLTHSCYDPQSDGRPCGHCDSCRLRAAGFAEAGATDPLIRPARLIPFARSPDPHWPSRSDARSFSPSSILTILVYLAIGYGARLTYDEHVRQLAAETGTMAATVVVYVNRNLETADAVAATASRHPGMRALDPQRGGRSAAAASRRARPAAPQRADRGPRRAFQWRGRVRPTRKSKDGWIRRSSRALRRRARR